MNTNNRTSAHGDLILTLLMVVVAVAVIAGQPLPGPTAAPEPPRTADSYYAASNQIRISIPVDGDVVIAGRVLDIDGEIAGDILAAGWRVSVRKPVSDDVRIAGAEVSVNAPVDGDVTLAGGDVTLGSDARVMGRAWLTGGTVRANGVFERELQIAGGTVQIAGEVRKPLTVIAETLEIQPTARILGPLTYKSPREARIMTGASIAGPITFTRIETEEARRAHSLAGVSSLLFVIHLVIAGLLFLLLLPRFVTAGVETLRAQPWRSLLLGFTLLVTVPIAALILVVTVLGAPVGVSLVALYLVALLLGILTTAYCIGEVEAGWLKIARPPGARRQAAVLIAGVVTLALLRAIAGGLVVFVAILFGLGALALWTYRTFWLAPAATA
jgi:cytoskeletal protein CcmA (bactofilin family)